MARVLDFYGIPVETGKFKILCPFHEDKNASLLVDVDDNQFHCFGCEKHGTALDFHIEMQRQKGKTGLKVQMQYSKITKGIEKAKQKIDVVRKKQVEDDEQKQFLIEAMDYYYGLRTEDWAEDESEERYYMEWRGFDVETLNEAKAKHTHNDYYPIVFPMIDNGEFKGWVCRTTDPEIQKKRKYLYNKGFSRRNTLVGEYGGKSKTVILVEGYMDMLKAIQHGGKNVVAILGWKITLEQVEKLKASGVTNVISALDNDTCGRKGTKYLRQFFNVYRFKYPTNVKDMGDISKQDFRRILIETKEEIQNGKRTNFKNQTKRGKYRG